jgi:DNA-binding NarL/FixJ family response regulator
VTAANKPKGSGKPKVVIGDDEMHLRELFKIMMTSLNTDVAAVARNGQEAVDLYRKIRPHLLLLDINMPGKNGDEALEEIMAEFPHAFVIMLTSVTDLETVKKCLDVGASNYILKDTPISEMKEIIKKTWSARLQAMRKRRAAMANQGGPKKTTAAKPN